jgi:hypothetical protein
MSAAPPAAEAEIDFAGCTVRLEAAPFQTGTLSKQAPFQNTHPFKTRILSKQASFQNMTRTGVFQ